MSVVLSPACIETTECAPVPHVRARMCGRVGCAALCGWMSELEAERLKVYHFFRAPAPQDAPSLSLKSAYTLCLSDMLRIALMVIGPWTMASTAKLTTRETSTSLGTSTKGSHRCSWNSPRALRCSMHRSAVYTTPPVYTRRVHCVRHAAPYQ